MPSINVGVIGCAHGALDQIYAALEHWQQQNQVKTDILLCCGDFQAVRNFGDLKCMAVPPKYQQMESFYKYYSGEAQAPILTVFIGGNHEASNYLAELPYGGWVAPNIYYLGYAGAVTFKGLRICGLSGIYRNKQYYKGHFEVPPFNEDTKRTAYYVRNTDILRLRQLQNVDVVLSHDWPTNIHKHGDSQALFQRKPFLREDAESGRLGNPQTEKLLQELMPKYWFAAHHHVKFPAVVAAEDGRETKFLALDKCLPRRAFMQILEVEVPEKAAGDEGLFYDLEWLAVLRSTDHLLNATRATRYMPGPISMNSSERWDFHPTEEELEAVKESLKEDLSIPCNFQQTARPLGENRYVPQTPYYLNPQTAQLCSTLGITNLNELLYQKTGQVVEMEPQTLPEPIESLDPKPMEFQADKPVEEMFFIDKKPAKREQKVSDMEGASKQSKTFLQNDLQ